MASSLTNALLSAQLCLASRDGLQVSVPGMSTKARCRSPKLPWNSVVWVGLEPTALLTWCRDYRCEPLSLVLFRSTCGCTQCCAVEMNACIHEWNSCRRFHWWQLAISSQSPPTLACTPNSSLSPSNQYISGLCLVFPQERELSFSLCLKGHLWSHPSS